MPQTITVYGLRANLRRVLDELAASGEPVILAERGRRPIAVLVSYAAWQGAAPSAAGSGAAAAVARELAAARQQIAQLRADLTAVRAARPPAGTDGARWGAVEPARWGQAGS